MYLYGDLTFVALLWALVFTIVVVGSSIQLGRERLDGAGKRRTKVWLAVGIIGLIIVLGGAALLWYFDSLEICATFGPGLHVIGGFPYFC
jgi:hypothetical protein